MLNNNVKKVEKGFLDIAVDYKWEAAASEADLRHDIKFSATIYSLESQPGHRRRKPSNLLVYRKSS